MKDPIRKLESRRATSAPKSLRLVVAALILRDAPASGSLQEILICQRRPDQPMGLKWEFPGGKIEPGETPEAALARELQEELGIDATIGRTVSTIRHHYRNGGAIEIQFFVVTDFRSDLTNRIFQDMRWAPLTSLPDFDFLAADLSLIRELAEGKLL